MVEEEFALYWLEKYTNVYFSTAKVVVKTAGEDISLTFAAGYVMNIYLNDGI